MRKFFTSGRRRYALALFVAAGSLVIMGNQCAPQPTKPPPPPTGLSISPTSHDFGSQDVSAGATSATTFTVTNNGPDTSGTLTAKIDGGNFSEFVKGPTDTCTSKTVAVGDTCTVDVKFDPNATGPLSSSLVVSSTQAADGTATAILTGTGTS